MPLSQLLSPDWVYFIAGDCYSTHHCILYEAGLAPLTVQHDSHWFLFEGQHMLPSVSSLSNRSQSHGYTI